MKANEAPEKIYLNWVNYPLEEMQVEYVRTDAFIEKACDAYCKICDTKECEGTGECEWINKFRDTIKKQ